MGHTTPDTGGIDIRHTKLGYDILLDTLYTHNTVTADGITHYTTATEGS